MDRTYADLMAAGKTQTRTDTVLELERRPQTVAFHLGVFERRHTDTRLDVRLDRLAGELVDEDRCQ